MKPLKYVLPFALLLVMLVNYGALSQAAESDVDTNIVSTGPCSYSLTLSANASTDQIWQHWYDVDNWKSYDRVLQYSYLNDDNVFEVGATGFVKAKGAPKTKFELTEVRTGQSFTESLKLPFGNTLNLKRRVVAIDENSSYFTHEVEFKGPLKGLMYFFLGKRFKKDLAMVMTNLKDLVEKSETKKASLDKHP